MKRVIFAKWNVIDGALCAAFCKWIMPMRKTKTLIMLLLLMGAPLFAQKTLVVELRDGSSASVALGEKPVLTFAGGQMSVVSSLASMEFKRSDVRKYHFVDGASSIVEQPVVQQPAIVDGVLIVEGLAEDVVVAVHNVGGVVVRQGVATAGCCEISLHDLAAGVYIVEYNNIAFKFLKK